MGRIGTFILGGIVGATIALLYAPKTGEQARTMVSEKVNSLMGEAQDWGAGADAADAYRSAQERGAALFQDFATKGQELFNTASDRVKGFTGQASAPTEADIASDELREKIEAARQRIAAQVIANAEQSVGTPVDVPAEQAVVEAVEAAE